ncbi:hypothetical protein [Streptomyces sp. NPDC001401]|uniref:hypothetical protein n=1 Tax=Streptomyces sp. NPDC001401 TaxID=3364570 RepID=UPI003689201B
MLTSRLSRRAVLAGTAAAAAPTAHDAPGPIATNADGSATNVRGIQYGEPV